MNDLLNKFKASTESTGRKRNGYSLDEVLGIMAMFEAGLKPKEVSELTGRTVHSLRYKFLEGEITLDGKKVTRSVKKFNTIEEIYADHGVEWDEDVQSRIDNFKASLEAKAQAV